MNAFVPQGLHVKTPDQIAQTIGMFGFNCVRLNWSLELFYRNPLVMNDAIRAMLDNSLELKHNTTALEVLDAVIAACARQHIMVILDNHISDASW